MNMNKLVLRLGQQVLSKRTQTQMLSTSCVTQAKTKYGYEPRPGYPDYTERHKLYAKFQRDDGVPVHLKRGPVDTVLYYIVALGVIIGYPYILWQMKPVIFKEKTN